MAILAELYHEWYSPRAKSEEDEKEEWARNEELWEQAEQCLGAELFRELQLSTINLMDIEACRTFQEGFRFAVQLMLEAYAADPHLEEKNALFSNEEQYGLNKGSLFEGAVSRKAD